MSGFPRWLIYLIVVLVVLSWMPLVMLVRARHVKSGKPRVHIIQDMDNQANYKAQARNRLFADRRAMRPDVPGTVARGELREDDALFRGISDATDWTSWVDAIPVPVSLEVMRRGRERYGVFCSPCHGLGGYGDGAVSKRAEELQEGTWTPSSSLHADLVRGRPSGHLYNSIANGIRNMPGYGSQIPVDDRWAIVAYLRALQRSQFSTVDDVPEDLRAALR